MNSLSSTLLQQVRVLDPLTEIDLEADVWIENGILKAIEPDISPPPHTTVITGKDRVFAPGLVDLYSHSGEPGHEERETLSSLIASATAGGFTRVTVLPDTVPPIDNPAILSALEQKCQGLISTKTARLQFWATLTLGLAGQQMAEFGDLWGQAIGFTDSQEIEDLGLLRRLLEYLKPFKPPIALFPVNSQLKNQGVMRFGEASIRFGLAGDPALSETVALAAILEMVAEIGTPVHLMRISTRRGRDLIAEAKKRGLPVTASVTWLHLLLNAEAIATYPSSLRLEPPLGNKSDRLALVAGIREGIIDAIAIDHSPYTYEEKTVAFAEAPVGSIGLELALPLLWEKLVVTGELSALQLWKSLSLNPSLCLYTEPISLAVGRKAEAILFDPQSVWTVTADSLQSRAHNTFWFNQSISGKVIQLWNR